MPKEDAETRRTRLKNLIKLGKERGFLTYAEINDHLPDDLVDAEQIEAIISTFGDMGIQVYDQAPDQETLLIAPTPRPWRSRRRRRGAGRSRAVDGRLRIRPHHRPGAHVHARDGLGRAAHARRRDRDRQAHRGRPAPHDPGDQRLSDHGAGDPRPRRQGGEGRDAHRRGGRWPDRLRTPRRLRPKKAARAPADEEEAQIEEEEGEDEEAAEAAQSASLLQLKAEALEKFARIRRLFEKMTKALENKGSKDKDYLRAATRSPNELMDIRFTARTVERLSDSVRSLVDEIRRYERAIHDIARGQGADAAPALHQGFPGHGGLQRWLAAEVNADHPWSEAAPRRAFDPGAAGEDPRPAAEDRRSR